MDLTYKQIFGEGPDMFPPLLVLYSRAKNALIVLRHVFHLDDSPVDRNLVKNLCHYFDLVFLEIKEILLRNPDPAVHRLAIDVAKLMINEMKYHFFFNNHIHSYTVNYLSIHHPTPYTYDGTEKTMCSIGSIAKFRAMLARIEAGGDSDDIIEDVLLTYGNP